MAMMMMMMTMMMIMMMMAMTLTVMMMMMIMWMKNSNGVNCKLTEEEHVGSFCLGAGFGGISPYLIDIETFLTYPL